jgi:hypothetical protein
MAILINLKQDQFKILQNWVNYYIVRVRPTPFCIQNVVKRFYSSPTSNTLFQSTFYNQHFGKAIFWTKTNMVILANQSPTPSLVLQTYLKTLQLITLVSTSLAPHHLLLDLLDHLLLFGKEWAGHTMFWACVCALLLPLYTL